MGRARHLALALAGGALAACTTTSSAQRNARQFQVSATLQTLPPRGVNSGIREVPPGATLRSAERFAVRVVVESPLYVYLLQRGAGAPSVVYPATGADAERAPAPAGRPLFIPNEGEWFILDDNPRRETLFVVASRRPLARDSLTAEIQRSPAGTAEHGDAPPAMTKQSRGPAALQRAPLEDSGVAVIRLWFHHEPRSALVPGP